MKSIIRGLISVLFMAVLCVGPGAYGASDGSCYEFCIEVGNSSSEMQQCKDYFDGLCTDYCNDFGQEPVSCVFEDPEPRDPQNWMNNTPTCTCNTPGGGGNGGGNGGGEGAVTQYEYVIMTDSYVGDFCVSTKYSVGCAQLLEKVDAMTDWCPEWDDELRQEYTSGEVKELMKNMCGLPDDLSAEGWDNQSVCKATLCLDFADYPVAACPMYGSYAPLSFSCTKKTCTEVAGPGWNGEAYGDNCSNCTKNCSTGYGVVAVATKLTLDKCSDEIPECEFNCAEDYYGIPNGGYSGCTKCYPEKGMICDGGPDFKCDATQNWFKATTNATECSKCPDNATCTTENGIQCHSGYYYKNENGNVTCPACPSHGKCEGGQKSFGCDNPAWYKVNESATVCTQCPANAQCKDLTPFSCNNPAWYKVNESATVCTQCPTGAECKDLMPVTCAKGYYQGGSTPPCTVCPGGGTTSGKNAASITDCYVAVNAGTGLTVYTWDEADDDNNVFGSYQCTVDARYVQ